MQQNKLPAAGAHVLNFADVYDPKLQAGRGAEFSADAQVRPGSHYMPVLGCGSTGCFAINFGLGLDGGKGKITSWT